ncbi:hypothetical protein AHAS_Ahas09G0076400 [Arachis hypogaea]
MTVKILIGDGRPYWKSTTLLGIHGWKKFTKLKQCGPIVSYENNFSKIRNEIKKAEALNIKLLSMIVDKVEFGVTTLGDLMKDRRELLPVDFRGGKREHARIAIGMAINTSDVQIDAQD